MTHIRFARGSIRPIAAALIFTLAGCALPGSRQQNNPPQSTEVINATEVTECVPTTPPSAEPSTSIVEDPKPVWPTPACPKVKPKKCPVCAAVIVANKPVLGEYELVTVDPPGFAFLARIDTGATSTSLHADEITRFERDGRKWVRFNIANPDTGEAVTLERNLVRRVRIKQAEDLLDRRLIVMMSLHLGNIERQIEVSLTDRSNMEFPLLIGRNFLLDTAVVDVSLRRTVN